MWFPRLFAGVLIAFLAGCFDVVLAGENPLGFEDARHLLARTCFAANEAEVEAFAALTRADAVDLLLSWTRTEAATPPPEAVHAPFLSPRRARLGQNLFAPPNVRGWQGGSAWLNTTTLLARKQFLQRLLQLGATRDSSGRVGASTAAGLPVRLRVAGILRETSADYDGWLMQFKPDDVPAVERLLLASRPARPIEEARGRALLRELVQDPVYQLE